jgi:hypothetical protein
MREYLPALWTHWVSLMSGVIGLLICIGLRIGRRVSPTISGWPDIPDYLFIGIGGCALFLAGYLAWSDEHSAAVDLRRKLEANEFNPKLKFNVYNGGFGPFPNNPHSSSLLFLDVGVRNTGTPTSLREWSVTAKLDGQDHAGTITLFDKAVTLEGTVGAGARIVHPEDFLPERTLTPITTGGETTGTLFAIMPDVNIANVREKDIPITVRCKDVSDRDYSFDTVIKSHGMFNPNLRVPGMKHPEEKGLRK